MGQPHDHVAVTIDTYNRIAARYHLAVTPRVLEWKRESIARFVELVPGDSVLVVGCGLGQDSRLISSRGIKVTSIDLSENMLKIAKSLDTNGEYIKLDIRDVTDLDREFDGIWAGGCLYHLNKTEFAACIQDFHSILRRNGAVYISLKKGNGEGVKHGYSDDYHGGKQAYQELHGPRYYAYYDHEEIQSFLQGFEIVSQRTIEYPNVGYEYWLRKCQLFPFGS